MARTLRIKDHWREQQLFTGRLLVSIVIVLGPDRPRGGRLVQLQVGQYEYFSAQSSGNRIRVQPIPPIRGLILDRNGKVLAENTPSYQLEMTPEQVPDMADTLRRLVASGILEEGDLPELKEMIGSRRSFDTVVVAERLTDEELAAFAVRRPHFPGLEIRARLGRSYPYGTAAAHLLGYVGGISADDKKILDPVEYAGTTHVGKISVERSFEARPARHFRPRGRRRQRARPEDAGARSRALAAGPRRDPDHRHGRAAGRRPGPAGQARRGGGHRSAQWRGAGLRQHAGLRPERHQRRTEPAGLPGAPGGHRPPDVQSRPARAVPARIHDQADGGAGRPALRRDHARSAASAAAASSACRAAATATGTGSRRAMAPSTSTAPSSSPATSTSIPWRGNWASSAWADFLQGLRPWGHHRASISAGSRPDWCPARRGRRRRSASPATRSGFPVKR